MSKTEQIMEEIRKTALFRELIPMEAGVGWPIPLRQKTGEERRFYLTLPFFGQAPAKSGSGADLFPPFAAITLDWSNLVPVEYVNLLFRRPTARERMNQPVGTFPHEALQQYSTVGEYLAARRTLLSMYDEMFEILQRGESLPGEWMGRFSDLLRILVEPSLLPFYRELGPAFYNTFLPVP